MKFRLPFLSKYSAFYKTDIPQFYTASHYLLSNILLIAAVSPLYIAAIGYYGLKLTGLLAISITAGFLTEYIGIIVTKKSTGYFGMALWVLFPLMTPPGLDIWITCICFILAIIITVIFFGGFGNQMFHPAVTAQVFIVVNFASKFGNSFLKPFIFNSYGFSVWSSLLHTDMTALKAMKTGGAVFPWRLLLGPDTGFFSDVVPALIIICGVLYIILAGVNRITPIWFLGSFILFSWLGNLVFPGKILDILPALLTGSVLFYAFFIFSDRWTSAKTKGGRAIAGIFTGLLTVMMRSFSSYTEAIMFASLAMYTFSPLFDEAIMFVRSKKRKRAEVFS